MTCEGCVRAKARSKGTTVCRYFRLSEVGGVREELTERPDKGCLDKSLESVPEIEQISLYPSDMWYAKQAKFKMDKRFAEVAEMYRRGLVDCKTAGKMLSCAPATFLKRVRRLGIIE